MAKTEKGHRNEVNESVQRDTMVVFDEEILLKINLSILYFYCIILVR